MNTYIHNDYNKKFIDRQPNAGRKFHLIRTVSEQKRTRDANPRSTLEVVTHFLLLVSRNRFFFFISSSLLPPRVFGPISTKQHKTQKTVSSSYTSEIPSRLSTTHRNENSFCNQQLRHQIPVLRLLLLLNRQTEDRTYLSLYLKLAK